jgi:hypothetical protein
MQKEALPSVVNNFSVMLLQKWYMGTAAVQHIVAVSRQLGVSWTSSSRKD